MDKTLIKILHKGFIFCVLFAVYFNLHENIFAKDDQNCSECHAQKNMRKYDDDGKLTELFTDKDMYDHSIHARLTCQTCHTSVKSTPHKTEEIEKVDCSAECHIDDTTIPKAYRHKAQYDTVFRSVHGASFEEKNVCGCHDPHRMTKAGELSSNEAIRECLKCHNDVYMMKKHKVSIKPQETYANSLHGEMMKFGDTLAPSCISCHNYHDIRRKDDPKSTLHFGNLLKVCKLESCHPSARPAFAEGSIHFIYRGSRKKIIYWIEEILLYIMLLTVVGMLIHYIMDFLGKGKERRKSLNIIINIIILLFIAGSAGGYYYFNINKKLPFKFDTFNLSAEFRSVCYTCHGEIVHKKNKINRAFMNRHTQKIVCETCHLKKKEIVEKEKVLAAAGDDSTLVVQEKGEIMYRWYDGSGRFLAGLRGNDGDDKAKISPYFQNDKEITFILSDKEGKTPLDFAVSKRGRECSECHKKEGLLDFKVLGYSDIRIKKMEELNVYKRMQKGETFFQQQLF
ncbi:MAG: hypothetical protein PHX78_06045 [bacterium]|nr:hypothetical protein [bacterium]